MSCHVRLGILYLILVIHSFYLQKKKTYFTVFFFCKIAYKVIFFKNLLLPFYNSVVTSMVKRKIVV